MCLRGATKTITHRCVPVSTTMVITMTLVCACKHVNADARNMTARHQRGNEMSDFIRTCPIGICLVQAGQECVCLAPLPPSDELSEPRPRGDKDEEDDSSHRRDQARKDGGPSIVTDEMVMRFLNWPLPESVCADSCTTEPGLQNRIGTNLLTELEARQMLEYVLALGETGPQESAHQAALAEKQARIDALMLEYCPDEMTPEQVAEWQRNQKLERQNKEIYEKGADTHKHPSSPASTGSQIAAQQAGSDIPSREPHQPASAAATPEV